jgi:hypothetical protein
VSTRSPVDCLASFSYPAHSLSGKSTLLCSKCKVYGVRKPSNK